MHSWLGMNKEFWFDVLEFCFYLLWFLVMFTALGVFFNQ